MVTTPPSGGPIALGSNGGGSTSRLVRRARSVGVATFSWADNYGAVLQAYALQQLLQGRGHRVKLLDFRGRSPSQKRRQRDTVDPLWYLRRVYSAYRTSLFENFRRHYFHRTTLNEQLSSPDGVEFDSLIAGSDQVWNPWWLAQREGLAKFFLLQFGSTNIQRLSFAASFGHSSLSTIDPVWRPRLGRALCRFDGISTREASGAQIVEELCGRNDTCHVLDPTLIAGAGLFSDLGRHSARTSIPFVFGYMLHNRVEEAAYLIRGFATRLGMRAIICDARSGIGRGRVLPTPVAWVSFIQRCSFLVTNSFHGVALSLLFHVPFAAIMAEGKHDPMNARITELLETLGLRHRACRLSEDLVGLLATSRIDWGEVDARLDEERHRSMSFLDANGL